MPSLVGSEMCIRDRYLVGLKYFQEEQIFSPELFVTVRKRIDENFFNDIMLSMHRKQVKETKASDKEDDSAGDSHAEGFQQTTHKGKMKIDATCTDAEVRYPCLLYTSPSPRD